jgi:chorismate mutase/prephenate dehydrogenase
MMDLKTLRDRLDETDRRLIEIAAERQRIVAEIGELKRSAGRELRDFGREREVLERAARNAEAAGIDPDLARGLLRQLIEASLARQEQDRVRAAAGGSGRRALVVGGAGRMGRWFARFLDAQGYAVEIADPAPCADEFPQRVTLEDGPIDHDLIIVAAPLRIAASVLERLAELRPPGVVFDLGSLKSPLAAGLIALREAGVRVTSVHPMFGPSANVLAGRHVIFVDVGVREATDCARSLFANTLAVPVEMGLDEHDRLIGYVLGLSHVLNIAFFTALAGSEAMAETLARISSTTFDRQLAIARDVASENPRLYFEIQHLNPHVGAAHRALEDALARVLDAVRRGDEEAFVEVMEAGRRYLGARPQVD